MKITTQSIRTFFKIEKSYVNKVTRIALNALMVINNCLITTMFFTASNIVTGLILCISIVGTAIVIEKIYR